MSTNSILIIRERFEIGASGVRCVRTVTIAAIITKHRLTNDNKVLLFDYVDTDLYARTYALNWRLKHVRFFRNKRGRTLSRYTKTNYATPGGKRAPPFHSTSWLLTRSISASAGSTVRANAKHDPTNTEIISIRAPASMANFRRVTDAAGLGAFFFFVYPFRIYP